MIQHIYPLNDLKEHETDSKKCWCSPQEEEIPPCGLLVIHNSADGREQYENGIRKTN